MSVITRFAPSPTWYVHIWSLRTVLYNYLFAKKNNGKFMLRVEDTDRSRYVEWSIENILEVLASVWLIPDEWPNNPWEKWPYFQSERLEIYRKYIDKLIDNDKVYYCFCSSDRLDNLRNEQKSLWLATWYDGNCRYLDQNEIDEKIKQGLKYTIRLKVPKDREVFFDDVIKWRVKVHSKDIDDQVLLKSDWFPTYHLANVVDDHLMDITHVIRWDEWTPSTPKHVIIYEAFGWKQPIFAHIPLLLWIDKKKLSKRSWDVSVESYLEKWYLTESIINYIALLWWNPKTTEEFFSMSDLIERFELDNVHKSGAVFDIERLNFFNAQYLKKINIDLIYDKFILFLKRFDNKFLDKISCFDKEYNLKILDELRTKIKKFDEYKDLTNFFYSEAKIPSTELLLNEKMKIFTTEEVKKWLNIALQILENNNDFITTNDLKNIFIEKIKNSWMKNWQVLWPIRVTLSWEEFSPWTFELIYILWNKKSSERIKKVLILL